MNVLQMLTEKFKAFDLEKKFLFFLLLVFFLNTLLWITILPYNHNPDEAAHYKIVKYIYLNKKLPVYGTDGFNPIIYKQAQGRRLFPYSPYVSMPGLNYIISALLMLLAKPFLKTNQLFYIARLVSLFSGLAVVYLAYKITDLLFPNNKYLKIAVPAFIAFLPQFTFISAYVNIDAFSAFTVSFFLYWLLKGEKAGWKTKHILFLGLAIGLVLLSKYNGYFVLLAGFIFFIVPKLKSNPRLFFKVSSFSLEVAFVVSGWWFVRNYILYKDILGLSVQNKAVLKLNPYVQTLQQKGFTYISLLTSTKWASKTFQSFFATFDYMVIYLDKWIYYVFGLLLITSAIGLYFYFRKNKKEKSVQVIVFFLLLVVVLFLACLNISLTYAFSPQGRYFFPAIIPFSIVVSLGLFYVFKSTILKKSLITLFLLFLVYSNLISLLGYIVPKYYTNLNLTNVNEPLKGIKIKPQHSFTQVFTSKFDRLKQIQLFYNVGKTAEGYLVLKSGSLPAQHEKEVRIPLKNAKTNVYNYYGLTNKFMRSANKKVYLYIRPMTKNPVYLAKATENFPFGYAFFDKKKTSDNLAINLTYDSNPELLSIKELYLGAPLTRNKRFLLLIIDLMLLAGFVVCFFVLLTRSKSSDEAALES